MLYLGIGMIIGHHIARLTRRKDRYKIGDTVIVFVGLAAIIFAVAG